MSSLQAIDFHNIGTCPSLPRRFQCCTTDNPSCRLFHLPNLSPELAFFSVAARWSTAGLFASILSRLVFIRWKLPWSSSVTFVSSWMLCTSSIGMVIFSSSAGSAPLSI
eukprot:TRINITY_DN19715_c0_g1_i2.p1 TRINITY_DN19715_c0_g1~~TRINITY_DN19715_c0_g1_i2.p1  ORF type:complete len:109 (+),score=14.46 TRINITY_DN19715_c0_g1_i2:528-854(+)